MSLHRRHKIENDGHEVAQWAADRGILGYSKQVKLQLQASCQLNEIADAAKPRYAFRCKNLKEAEKWQKITRNALKKKLGLQEEPLMPLSAMLVEKKEFLSYTREKILLKTSKYSVVPVYLLIPRKENCNFLSVIALHGHGNGVKDIIGLDNNGAERRKPKGCHKDFALELCRRGFTVAAPELACFGERRIDFSHINTAIGQEMPTSCYNAFILASFLGRTIIGLRIQECRTLINYLQTRSEFDAKRLGAMGLSGGGALAFYLSAVEPRIKAAVVSGFFCSLRYTILRMFHCPCAFIPGQHEFGDLADIAGLIAPRSLLIEAGRNDPTFPFIGVKKITGKARKVYRVFKSPENFVTDYFDGVHEISGRKAYDFLLKKMS